MTNPALDTSTGNIKMTFERLPSEILLKIVTKLPFRDDGKCFS
jgi:hypothetical protein